ncbi:hypothetical protein QE152_g8991 [Popillia japonica]|uniref:Endonuclease/exonuclease/phosphatase domain-containing protein n=1 Tax=Popillia japonica TaxID=7064 RepID=A0AAW1M067_POPJA
MDDFENCIALTLPLCDELLCVGDFNINLLDINLLDDSNSNVLSFNEVLGTYGLTQIISDPTRVTEHSVSLIDLIITSNTDITLNSLVRPIHNFSDHFSISCDLPIHNFSDHFSISCDLSLPPLRTERPLKTFRNFKNFYYDAFYADLVNAPFYLVFDSEDIDDKIGVFNSLLTSLLDAHAPYKTCRTGMVYKPWITDTIKDMQKLRDQAFSKYKRTRNPAHFSYYKSLRNVTTSAIRREKKAYLDYRVRNTNQKHMWKDFRNLDIVSAPSRNNVLPPNLLNADAINNYFSSLCSSTASANPDTVNYYLGEVAKNNIRDLFSPISNNMNSS